MRKTQSQFNLVCAFINMHSPGRTFTTREYIDAVGHKENFTDWKLYSGNRYYTCHQYKGYLGKTGFIKNIHRGLWRVEKRVPAWFTLGNLQHFLGYKGSAGKYGGMTQNDLRNILSEPDVFFE